MLVSGKIRHILVELRGHAPFTLLGALGGVLFMLIFRNVDAEHSRKLFGVFHPAHVVLSAMVTASMFKLHKGKGKILLILVVGYFGSVGIATLSDVVIPHFGTDILGLNVPSHAQVHEPGGDSDEKDSERHKHNIHLGFIEEWYIVNPAALLGVFIAFFLPRTKLPHTAHVLVSTWASSSYLLMSIESKITMAAAMGIFATLFIATWVPCCISDIIFPLLFVKSDIELTRPCTVHGRHSHPHEQHEDEK